VQSGIRAPISPASKQDPDVVAGRQLFIQNNCHSCHGTSQWTTSRVRYTPPPDPSLIQNAEIIGELRSVDTFDPNVANEVRATAAAPMGADGFNPPSLLSLFAFPQTFFHGGAAATSAEVQHAGLSGTGELISDGRNL
jgi:mono/diheme cytochrome c family protein